MSEEDREEDWEFLIEQAIGGMAAHLLDALMVRGNWPKDRETRNRLLVVLMLGPWEGYRKAFVRRLFNKREPALKAGMTELYRLLKTGEKGADWIGNSGRPPALNEFWRWRAQILYMALRLQEPDLSERQIRERVRTAMDIEEVTDATLRKILNTEKTH